VIAVPVHYRVRRLPFTYGAEDIAVLVTSRARPGLDGTLVAGLDLAGIGQAARRLAVIGLAVGGVVILGIGCLGTWVIRTILRPVRMVERAVAAASAGDLASRVPHRHARRQPGSLACSVNAMLSQIDHAFRDCAKSEAAARESAQQMRRIITGTSHQLRRPVSIINGAAAWYTHRGQLRTGELDRIMRQVTDQAARIEALTDELRTGAGPVGRADGGW
jgi:two-component system OmpR family sensor kinase